MDKKNLEELKNQLTKELEEKKAALLKTQSMLKNTEIQLNQVTEKAKEKKAQQQELEKKQSEFEKEFCIIKEKIEEELKIGNMFIPTGIFLNEFYLSQIDAQMMKEINENEIKIDEYKNTISQQQAKMKELALKINVPLVGFDELNPLEFYDQILGFTNLSQLFDGIPYSETKRQVNASKNQRRIGVIGQKGKGKTFLLQHILSEEENKSRRQNIQQTYGQVIQTIGISVIIDKHQMYFDMQAMSDSVEYFKTNPQTKKTYIPRHPPQSKTEQINFQEERKYQDKVSKMQQDMTDRQENLELFITNFVISQCQVLIIVVSILTFEEQQFILETMQKYPRKQIYIVHNIQEVENLDQLNRKIASDIIDGYQCEILDNLEIPKNIEDFKKAPKIYLDTASVSKFQVQHLVIGQQNKPSGIPHVCHEYTDYNLIKAFNSYFQKNIQNHFNFELSKSEHKEEFLQAIKAENQKEWFIFNDKKDLLFNPVFLNRFSEDYWNTPNFILHPLQINDINISSRENPYYLCENNEEINLLIPIPFAEPGSVYRKFQISKSFDNDYQQFEFKYIQKEQPYLNQEISYLINICSIRQNLKEFQVQKQNGKIIKRYFKEIINDNTKLGGYKHYKFVKVT